MFDWQKELADIIRKETQKDEYAAEIERNDDVALFLSGILNGISWAQRGKNYKEGK